MKIFAGLLVALPAVWYLSEPASGQSTADGRSEASAERIDELILHLNDDRYSVRREAEVELLKLGKPAFEALQKLAESDNNAHRIRARRLLRRLMLTLTKAGEISDEALRDVTSVVISDCGKYAYTAAYTAGAVSFFSRNPETGELTHEQTVRDPSYMVGAVSVRLSPDQTKAVAACFRSKSVVLFQINPNTGSLNQVDVLRGLGPSHSQAMSWTIEANFSDDSKFIYALDPAYGRSGAVITIRVDNNSLKWVQTNRGENGCFRGVRGIDCHPNGKWIYVTSDDASTLTVLARDEKTGKTKVLKVYKDSTEGIRGLGGAFAVACSPDGRFVYTSSGRFRGDDTVGVYRVEDDGQLALVQEIQNGDSELDGFEGGNEILVTPDGKYVYAAATRSSMVAGFRRDKETGRLTVLDTESIALVGAGNLGPAGLGISPQGEHLYVAAESPGKIIIFRRRTLE